jgi:hypothetical protein
VVVCSNGKEINIFEILFLSFIYRCLVVDLLANNSLFWSMLVIIVWKFICTYFCQLFQLIFYLEILKITIFIYFRRYWFVVRYLILCCSFFGWQKWLWKYWGNNDNQIIGLVWKFFCLWRKFSTDLFFELKILNLAY